MDTFFAVIGRSPAASLLLAAIVLPSLFCLYVRPALLETQLFRPYWLLRRRQFLTPLSSAFLHADLPHLLFNSISFWAFAFPLERRIGSTKFLLLYFFGLLVSDLATYVKQRHNPAYASLGASGAILAVLFAAIVYVPTASIFILPIPVPIPAPLFAVLYLAYTVWASRRARGRVNHDAHLAGALAGMAFVALADPDELMAALRYLLGQISAF